MSDPKQFLIYGDLNVAAGLDSSLGDGSVFIASALDVDGHANLDRTTINTTDGVFSVQGTNNVSFNLTNPAALLLSGGGNSNLESKNGTLTLSSTVDSVIVNTGTGFDVNATTSITLDSNSASYFKVSGGSNLTLEADTGRTIMTSGSSASNALTLSSTNASGGIQISSGVSGVNITSTDGPFSFNAQNVASNLSLSTNNSSQDLSINLTGATDSSIVLNSSGTGLDAIKMNSTAGSIDINSFASLTLDAAGNSNFTVTGAFDLSLGSTAGSVLISAEEAVANAIDISSSAGGISLSSGTLGTSIDTTGGFSINGVSASNISLVGTNALTVSNTGGQLVLQSTKSGIDSVRIYASNAAGGIDVDSGTGGISLSSQGAVSINAVGSSSNLSLLTDGNDQDLTIQLSGATDSSIVLESSGTSTDALKINTSAGGIDIDSFGQITIDTENIGSGIKIGTATAVPITIGTISSITTIAGDLVVSGTSTTINTQTLTVNDNVIAINSGMGELGADGGILIRRYQTANNDGSGDVVSDTGTGTIVGIFQSGSATPGTLVLGTGASAVDGFYNGFWIKFTISAITFVRRIKEYIGSTKTATIYASGEEDGLDLVDAPTNEPYTLYNSPYISTFYKESNDRWNIAYTSLTPEPLSEAGTSLFAIQRYSGMDVGAITIKSNGIPANSVLNVNVINETTANQGVTVEGVLIKDGLVGGSVPDSTEIVSLLDNSTAAVDITSSGTAGSYMILVTAVQTGNPLLIQSTGAHATFVASSSGVGGGNTRLSASRGTAGQRIDITWNTGEKIKLRHSPVFTGGTGVSVLYKVKVIRVV